MRTRTTLRRFYSRASKAGAASWRPTNAQIKAYLKTQKEKKQ